MRYSVATLEFERLLGIVALYAQTPMGKAKILASGPFAGRAALGSSLDAVREAQTLNEEKQVKWSFSGLEDPAEQIALLRIRDAALDPLSLLEAARVCEQAVFAKHSLQPEKEIAPTLWQFVAELPRELTKAVEEIKRKILPGGELDDDASPELALLRREINAQRARLTKTLESAMRAAGSAIQDEIVTVRNDRFVIPVKADFRGKVGGVAHGFSSSGATVYVEPFETIEANNELQNLKGKEERETAKILFALTESLRELLPAVEAAVTAVTELDAVKAKLEFSRSFKAAVPGITDDGTLELIDARHPLLEYSIRAGSGSFEEGVASTSVSGGDDGVVLPQEIVPSSIALSAARSVMIISGANAGGKTVVLKTAGLLSLMAISGLPVPAASAKVPFYRSILADIGDHQSLSSNLSTFSSHMSNIAGMLRDCEPPSLVLLDEAGTGTDPEEGSALGVAIVDYFRRKGAQVIASTHYRGLKMYAANDPNVINASVEFDEKTLRPTYRLMIGIAGASSGLEIARRFGITDDVIAAARENLDTAAQEAENYLRRLQTETRQAEDLRIALEEEREAVAEKFASLEKDAAKREKARQREFEAALARTVEDFDRQSKAFLKTIEDKAQRNKLDKERLARKAELNRAVIRKVSTAESPRRGDSKKTSPAYQRGVASTSASDVDGGVVLSVGSHVITSFGNIGVIERMDKDVAEVLVGGMRLREKLADLQLSEPPASAGGKAGFSKGSPRNPGLSRPIDAPEVAAELNLIGMTTAEAEYELDRFLDEAYMASQSRIRIIHGHGTGALKNFVRHFLNGHPHVEKYEFAPSNQGGNGATIAKLKL
jgi:DNA mismatch repair protein MutS2